jgi:NitT/TauT family transport system substrate-binding protein
VFVTSTRNEHDARGHVRSRKNSGWSRRGFLSALTLAGAAGFLGVKPNSFAAEPAPETKKLKLIYRTDAALCLAPQYVAEELLRVEGFTAVEYVKTRGATGSEKALASGEANLGMHFVPSSIARIEAGDPIVIIGGGHVGCYELFASRRVHTIRDLKGKNVAVTGTQSLQRNLIGILLAQVGLDPLKDVNWVVRDPSEQIRLLAEEKIDAFMAFPPTAQELRTKKVGHVVFNSMMDRPWSQYFCCMVAGNKDFVHKNPAATKRALRGILKAADLCGREPERMARVLMDQHFTDNYDYALQTMKDMHYDQWRDYDPEDTVRFFSLRLHEIGVIKSSPQKIIAQGTDWRFLRELKKELKT